MADIKDLPNVPMIKIERLRHACLNYGKQMAKATESIDKVDDAVESFFGQIFKTKEDLKAQLERKGKTEGKDGIEWKEVEENDALYISLVFDSLEWWKSVGQNQHPLIFLPLYWSLVCLNQMVSKSESSADALTMMTLFVKE